MKYPDNIVDLSILRILVLVRSSLGNNTCCTNFLERDASCIYTRPEIFYKIRYTTKKPLKPLTVIIITIFFNVSINNSTIFFLLINYHYCIYTIIAFKGLTSFLSSQTYLYVSNFVFIVTFDQSDLILTRKDCFSWSRWEGREVERKPSEKILFRPLGRRSRERRNREG